MKYESSGSAYVGVSSLQYLKGKNAPKTKGILMLLTLLKEQQRVIKIKFKLL